MGSIQTKQFLPNKNNFDILDYGYCIVWRRKKDQYQLMQQYSISIQSNQKLKLYQSIWPLRTKNTNLVNVYYFSHEKSSNFCGQIAKGSIYTQRIPYRLSQFYNMPLEENLNILKKSLQIYKELQENYGVFIVRSTMIGFTQNYILKIWVHTDFSQPQPENQNCNYVGQMIRSIISAIQSVSENYYYSYSKFSDFLNLHQYSESIKSFQNTLKALIDYMNRMKIKINDHFHKIKYYKKKPEGWQKFKPKSVYPVLISGQNLQNQNKDMKKDFSSIQISSNNIENERRKQPKSIYQIVMEQPFQQGSLKSETSQRVNIKSFKNLNINQDSILINKFQPRINSIYVQEVPQNNIRIWKSTQRIQQRIPSKQIISNINSSQLNRYQSPLKNTLTNQFSEYYGIKKSPLQFNRAQVKFISGQNNDYNQRKLYELKNAEVSTTTDNFQKSQRSSISLIQDLQIQQSRSRKFYNSKRL